jgi:predicted alpha/beta-hydrolase family hydrolase
MKPTAAQRRRFARVVELGCQVCRLLGIEGTPTLVHHVRANRLGVRDHDAVIGLCDPHHVGPMGVHTLGRRFREVYGVSEADLLELVNEQIGG